MGIFRLTDPQGMDIVSHCSTSGFHPHPYDESVLYCVRARFCFPATVSFSHPRQEVSGGGKVYTVAMPLVCRDFRR